MLKNIDTMEKLADAMNSAIKDPNAAKEGVSVDNQNEDASTPQDDSNSSGSGSTTSGIKADSEANMYAAY